MIKVQKMVPEVYYNRSRDFQLFGRLYEIIFNYIKYNTSAIQDISENLNPNQNILELMCNTLGFTTTHSYSNDQLSALCSIFLKCIKQKGTISSIRLLVDMVCSVENSKFKADVNYDFSKDYVYIIIPSDVTDLTLIRDVLNYILPAGCRYVLTSRDIKTQNVESTINLTSDVNETINWGISSSAIAKIEGKEYMEDIHNYNISQDGEVIKPAKNIESVNSTIITLSEDVDLNKKISENLVKTNIDESGE